MYKLNSDLIINYLDKGSNWREMVWKPAVHIFVYIIIMLLAFTLNYNVRHRNNFSCNKRVYNMLPQ